MKYQITTDSINYSELLKYESADNKMLAAMVTHSTTDIATLKLTTRNEQTNGRNKTI